VLERLSVQSHSNFWALLTIVYLCFIGNQGFFFGEQLYFAGDRNAAFRKHLPIKMRQRMQTGNSSLVPNKSILLKEDKQNLNLAMAEGSVCEA
jgi:hypothetical protein